jgi:serine/threonine protein kinase
MRIEDERSSSRTEAPLYADARFRELAVPGQDSGPCLSEEEVLAFSEGSLMPSEIDTVHAHLDGCPTCLELVNAAVHHWDRPPPAQSGERVWMATFGAGQIISGRYQIERFIGRGGMGEVYLAFDRVLTEHVALKTLLSTISDNPHAIHRLLGEARLARRISHPNVCRVHDVGVHDEPGRVDERLHFLTMEYIDGSRLGQLLRAGPMEIPRVIEVARQILLGLGAAHGAGVLHRDLKSDNIMVSGPAEEQRIAITDFGLSQALGADAQAVRAGHERVGSVSYMAPEQILGHELSPATDIFAFGVVLFEMLCAQLPFAGHGATRQTALRRLSQKAVPPSQLRPEVGPALDRLVASCLMERPEDRCASAEQALAMLEDAVTVYRPSAIYPTARRCGGRSAAAPSSGIAELPTVVQGLAKP